VLKKAGPRSGQRQEWRGDTCTMRVFEQDFALEDAIGSHACSLHACSLQANMRVTNSIPLGSPLLFTVVATINHVETLKVQDVH
jgi:hypothetical protein